MITRRQFAGRLAASAAASCLVPSLCAKSERNVTVAAPRIGAQVYVWTQYFGRRKEQIRDHVDEMLSAHASAGIRNLELMHSIANPELHARLLRGRDTYGLSYPVVYTGTKLYDRGGQGSELARIRQVAADARALGAAAINCNPDPKPQKARKTGEELAAEVDGLNQMARLLREEGLLFYLHQHDAEMQENSRNWRFWLQNTDSGLVKFCLDTHWVLRGGQDPLALLKECRPRLASLHLRNSRNGIWREDLDDGDLDYRPIAQYLRQTGYRGFLFIELAWDSETQLTRPLDENLRRSRTYVERRFF